MLAKLGPTQQPYAPNKTGYVMIVIVLILASVFSIVLVKMTIQSIVALKSSSLKLAEARFTNLKLSCVEESLIQLTRNPEYTGGTINLFSGSCISTVSPSGDYQNIEILTTQNGLSDSLLITFDPAQKKIVAWDN